jgi:hypothetical protein
MSFAAVVPATSVRGKQLFVTQFLDICGDTRLLWLPSGADTTTTTDSSLNARTVTYDATIAAQLANLGSGYKVSFDGTSDFGSTPDAAGLSFGTGAADSAFSVLALAKVTDTAASRTFVAKYNAGGTAREWEFRVTGADALYFGFYDESVDVAPNRASSSAITQGSWKLFGGVYTAATGGATAANDITLYQDGVSVTSTATNSGTYVAMEDTAAPVNIGARGSTTPEAATYMSGDMALVAVVAKALSATEMFALYKLCDWYFNFLA